MTDPDQLAQRFGLSREELDELRSLLGPTDLALRTTAGRSRHTATWSPDLEDGMDPSRVPVGEGGLPPRYEDRGLLGVGGMGEVRRVWDRELKRTVAMKILKGPLSTRAGAVQRFVEEAQTSAQLQHPGVLPIHELGTLDDGRSYFTMQEIRGRTLAEAIAEVHEASVDGWGVGPSGIGFRRLIEVMRSVCEAVGYAHRRGVVHRDLKPANLLLGNDGEVLVVDWGIARIHVLSDDTSDPVVTDRGPRAADSQATSLAGTPAYMPPEQARGDAVGPWTDVWALGAVLYEVLTGSHPHQGIAQDLHALVVARMTGMPPVPVRELARLPVPEELAQATERALDHDPRVRPQSGAELAAEIGRWLDGEARKERGRLLVAQAREKLVGSEALARQAAEAESRAKALEAALPERPDERARLPVWAEEDRARDLRQQSGRERLAAEQRLHAALLDAPDLPAAREALADHYRTLHTEAEGRRDPEGAERAMAFLVTQVDALAEGEVRSGHARYVEGLGALTLVTDPPGAEVVLHRYETHRRRLVARAQRVVGPTPIRELPLEAGSWLAVIRHPDCEEVRYPVQIDRLGHWDGVAPGEVDPTPVALPLLGSLGPTERYVPAGWFLAGGDPEAPGSFPLTRVWVDAFVAERDPVTNRDWLRFVEAVAATEGLDAAWQMVPTDSSGLDRDKGIPIYTRNEAGRFEVGADPDGDTWELDWPVVMLTVSQGRRYLAWKNQTGKGWRLPADLEWEKAARGVDGRSFPWGDHFDPSWCSMRERRPSGLFAVDAHPIDTSVYGLRGLAGNASEWCLEQVDGVVLSERLVVPSGIQEGERQSGRGGSWASSANSCRCASRGFSSPYRGLYSHGLRVVRSWTG